MTNIKDYKYDLISAIIEHNINDHPQRVMKNLGFHVLKAEPCPIADCWFFRASGDNAELPAFLDVLSDGFRFSDE